MTATLTKPHSEPAQTQKTGGSSINITEYLKEEQRKHHESTSQWERAAAELERKLKDNASATTELQKQRDEKSRFMEKAKGNGLDTGPLVKDITAIDAEIAKASKAAAALRSDLEKLAHPPNRNFETAFAFAKRLVGHYECIEAKRIASMNECYSALRTTLGFDDVGRPQKLVVDLGANQTFDVSIKSDGKRFAKGFRPNALEWLPSTESTSQRRNEHPRERSTEFLAYFDETAQRLMLSSVKLTWYEERQRSYISYGQDPTERITKSADISDLADSLPEHFQERLKAAGGAIDLQQTYESNPLAAELRARVLTLTTTDPRFMPASKTLTSQAIYAAIKADWDAFIKCPWADHVTSNLALLKYNAENDERPRFWCGPFEGQYRFRLRTRDHSWIMGELYIDQSVSLATVDSPMAITSHVATLGRMHMCITSNQRDW